MPWWQNMIPIPESLKKHVVCYLLERYFGRFMAEKLSLDQLKLHLWQGNGTVEKIKLYIQALNEICEQQNWALEFVDGYIGELDVTIPWGSILRDRCILEVRGLRIIVQPRQRHESATSVIESMWNSMTSSVQLAEECAKEDASKAIHAKQTYEGEDLFSQTIDSILGKVKIKFIDTVIQFEHVPKDSSTGVGLLLEIDLIDYFDESSNNKEETTKSTNDESKMDAQSYRTKKFIIEGVNLSTVEFSSEVRTFSNSVLLTQSQQENENDESISEYCDLDESNSSHSSENTKEYETLGQEKVEADSDLSRHRHVVKFGQFSKSQEVHISLKQSETFDGPKVWIHLDLKFLIMFLSPRQLHVLIELAKGLASPDIEDTINVSSRLKCVPKPMSGSDYQRVEQELQRQIQPLSNLQLTGLRGIHGWSSPSFDESYTEENFLPMDDSTMSESFMSGAYRSMDSSVSSSMTTSTTGTCRARKSKCSGSDPNADSHFHVECDSVALVLLHEDMLIPSCERGQLLVPSSVQQMQQTVKEFFGNIGCFVPNPEVQTHFEDTEIVIDKACSLNNFRLLAAGLNMGSDEKTTKSTFYVSGRATATRLEIVECLFDSPKRPVEKISILRFVENNPTDKKNVDSSKHNIDVHFRHVKNISKYTTRRNSEPKTDISVVLNKCELDFDITIIDRLTAFLEPPDLCTAEKSKQKTSTGAVPDSEVGSRTDLRIFSPRLDIKLRFPIPDFRPAHDLNRIPWWKKNIRSDYLSLVLTDIQFKSTFQTFETVKEYEIQSKGLHIYYVESENSSPLQIAKCEFDNGLGSIKNVYKNRLCIKISPHEVDDSEEFNEPQRDPMTTSMYDAFENQTCAQPGPFNAKKVVHQSDTPHFRMQEEDAPELIIPGDKPEIDEFIRSTISYSRIQLEVFIPMISMRFPSKHLYEVIYNRINNDLLLWKPCAPKPRASVYEDEFCPSLNPVIKNIVDGHETFFAMSNGMHESDSGSGDESEISVNLTRNREQSQFVLNIQIAQGLLIINPPARDSSTNVIPGQQGEFLLNLGDANVFVVSGYEGDDTLGYVCVQLHDAQLYHSEMMPTPNMIGPIKEFGSTIEKHLNSTLHRSETGMLANANQSGGSREMITVAVKIQGSHETHHVKTVQVSIGLNKATLKHRVCQGSNSWISHMLDFFNVQDYPIPNYRCKEVLSEIHLHLWDCAIDYRPKYLPVRSVVTIGTFSLTSQLSVKADSPTLRFIFEECGLFLSDRSPPKSGVVSSAPVDLKKDYVNVIDLGIFEISLRTNDKVSPSSKMDDEEKEEQPLTDLRASNNVLNIHTCSDSGKMLMQLLIYFASDGDLSSPASKESPFDSPRHHQVEQELIVLEPQSMSNLSKSQHEHINTLLGEAMIESKVVPVPERTSYQPGTNMFYFPGENQLEDLTVNSFPQVTSDLGDVNYFTNRYSEPDEDFCFIEDGPGLGRFPKNGLPEINLLTSERIHIIEDHFRVPTSKGDVFQRPKSFPCPLTRYTLCDMTVVWNMYGGNDFQLTETEKPKKTVNFSASNLSGSVSFSNARQSEVKIKDKVVDKKTTNLTWMRKGGVNRDHKFHMELHLNKIRFQHEVYPETTTQASRQVLIISDIEIIDRLESSEINKFLYQYSSQARPKQSQAHMIVIKALHVRPDPKLLRQECCLKISMLPLRFNIDQDSLLFLIRFFTELSNGPVNSDDQEELACFSKNNTPTHQPPVMAIGDDYDKQLTKQARQVVDENLIILMEESKIQQDFDTVSVSSTGSASDGSPVYFRKVIFSPDVLIKLDYHGKRVDMTHGSLPGLLLGLGHLNCSELRLKRLKYRKGLLGNDKLLNYLMKEWLNDIKKNQLPSILGGVGPMHSLVQLFQGVRDLFWLPIEQYQKDGRIIRGLQRGANSFTTSTATAALELTSRLIHLIQITAETAYDMLSPGPSVKRIAKSKGKRRRHHNPQDIREGMANAISVVREGFGETANNIVKVAALEKEQKGYSGAVGGVLRQIPPTMLKPIIIASEATGNVLGGMRCQLVPDARQEDKQKWRTDDR